MSKRLTNAQKGAICEAYKSGKKAADIAKFFSVSLQTVYSTLKVEGIDLQYPKKAVRKPAEEEVALVAEEAALPPTTGDFMELLNNIGRAILLVHEDLRALTDSLS